MLGPVIAYGQSLYSLRRFLPLSGGKPIPDRQLIAFALPVSAGLLGVTYLFNIDVILARHYLPPDAAGIYAAAAILGRVVFVATYSIAGVMFPEVTALHARNQSHFHIVELSLGLMVALALLAVGVGVAGTQWATEAPVTPMPGAEGPARSDLPTEPLPKEAIQRKQAIQSQYVPELQQKQAAYDDAIKRHAPQTEIDAKLDDFVTSASAIDRKMSEAVC